MTTFRLATDRIYPWYALAVINMVVLLATIDRLVFIIQAEALRQHFSLTDVQMGILQGLGVTVVMGLAIFPAAWLADKYDRRSVLAGCVIFWSLAMVGCGFAQDFSSLLIASALVGAGSAGLAPTMTAIIPELFEGTKRQVANSITAAAGRLGYGLGLSIVGYLVVLAISISAGLQGRMPFFEPWRMTFLLSAVPAPALVLMLLWLRPSRPPLRQRRQDVSSGKVKAPFLLDHWATIAIFTIGQAFVTFAHAALLVWIPITAMRQFGGSSVDVGNWFGVAITVATASALMITSTILPKMLKNFGGQTIIKGLVALGAGSTLACAFILFAVSVESLAMLYTLYLVFEISVLMIIPTVLQTIIPAFMRARMSAVMLAVSIVPAGLSQVTVGFLSDIMRPAGVDLLTVVSGTGLAGITASTIMFWLLIRRFGGIAFDAGEYSSSETH